jgi:hypothetical protein
MCHYTFGYCERVIELVVRVDDALFLAAIKGGVFFGDPRRLGSFLGIAFGLIKLKCQYFKPDPSDL